MPGRNPVYLRLAKLSGDSFTDFASSIMDLVSETPKTFMAFYNELWSMRDKRMDDWPLMSSPWPTITLCVLYFYISLGLGPTLMKDRPAFKLTRTIQIYNVFQVGSCHNFTITISVTTIYLHLFLQPPGGL